LKSLSSFVFIVEGQAEFGEHEGAQKTKPVNLFMADDIMFYNMVIGKEGMSGWWCSYCKLFKIAWQQVDHEGCEPWTIEMLTPHALKIENAEINKNDIHAVCGIQGSQFLMLYP
jgi:hypothetical protein